jgi:hypothetical protein
MSTSDPLIAEFERLLERFPDTFTLQQWQFAYKKVIFRMGMEILERFPQNAYGPPPPPPPPVEPSGGPWGPGPIIHLASAALGLGPTPPQ